MLIWLLKLLTSFNFFKIFVQDQYFFLLARVGIFAPIYIAQITLICVIILIIYMNVYVYTYNYMSNKTLFVYIYYMSDYTYKYMNNNNCVYVHLF